MSRKRFIWGISIQIAIRHPKFWSSYLHCKASLEKLLPSIAIKTFIIEEIWNHTVYPMTWCTRVNVFSFLSQHDKNEKASPNKNVDQWYIYMYIPVRVMSSRCACISTGEKTSEFTWLDLFVYERNMRMLHAYHKAWFEIIHIISSFMITRWKVYYGLYKYVMRWTLKSFLLRN